MFSFTLIPSVSAETRSRGRSTTSTFRAQTIERLDTDLLASRAEIEQLRAGRDQIKD